MNQVALIGRLGKDPDLRYSGETAVCRFTLAVDDGYGENKKTYWPSIVCFKRTAELVDRYAHKGSKVAVLGKLTTGSYTNNEGRKIYTTEVVANHVEFLDSKNNGVSGLSQQRGVPDGFTALGDDDIPFN